MEKTSKIDIAGHTCLVGSAILGGFQSQSYGNLILRTHQELGLEIQRDVDDFFRREKPESAHGSIDVVIPSILILKSLNCLYVVNAWIETTDGEFFMIQDSTIEDLGQCRY